MAVTHRADRFAVRAPRSRGRDVVFLLAAAAAVGLIGLLGRVALEKGFSIDEFQYGHASWLMARGELPYRDFFEVHFPLVYILGSLVFRVAGESPEAMIALRWMMLPFAVLTCVAVAVINRRDRLTAVLTPVVLITTVDWSVFAAEVRPDAIGAALFVAALALLSVARAARLRGFFAGALVGWAVASSQKTAFYAGGTVVVLLTFELLSRRQTGRPGRLGNTPLFLVGAILTTALAALPLVGPGMAEAFWKWAVLWGAEHQQHYPGFSWLREVRAISGHAPVLLPLCALGLVAAVRQRRDLLLCTAFVMTVLSAALQTAPFRYSFLAALALAAVFAARGAVWLASTPLSEPARRVGHVAAAAAILLHVALGVRALGDRLTHDNRHQRETLARIGALTRPDEVAYDNSGSFVARHHVDFYFYTDKYLRYARAQVLERELPVRIVERGCILKLADAREADLPEGLRRFLSEWFHPYDGDLSFWGRRYDGSGGSGDHEARFIAPRTGRYFVTPADAVVKAQIHVNGVALTGPELTLQAGTHRVRYDRSGQDFHLLWLPADGRHWTPAHGEAPRFSRIFY